MTADLRARVQAALAGSFTLHRELGGGMSRVFVARERALDRDVVVKVLPPELAADVNMERFKREVQLAARLQHPNITPLLTAGEIDGLAYFTMPLVAGESLRTRIDREGALSFVDTIRILHGVADALAFAHDAGIVHRDIKPENILLVGQHALVTDFGVAKALTSSAAWDTVLAARHIAVGTPVNDVNPAAGAVLEHEAVRPGQIELHHGLAHREPFQRGGGLGDDDGIVAGNFLLVGGRLDHVARRVQHR